VRKVNLFLAILAPAAALACGRQDGRVVEDPPAGEPPGISASATDDTVDEVNEMLIPLVPVTDSGINGRLLLLERGEQTEVTLQLRGAAGSGTHQAHVHRGDCNALGPAIVALEPVVTDDSGSGSSSSMIDIAMDDLVDGEHLVAAHEAGGDPGSPVVCGGIPALDK
jgi:hypothetical protein